MKIEKINDNQIRCILSKKDLAERDLKLSELAYGSGKTKELFQDMMRQANDDFGFEVNDFPLMVEAMPLAPDSVVLVVTKVENPEDSKNGLSNLFSKELTDELFSQIENMRMGLEDFEEIDSESSFEDESDSKPTGHANESLLYSIYMFNSLSEVITVAQLLSPFYNGDSSVYKSPYNEKYYLSLCMETPDDHLLTKICSILTEHGVKEEPTYAKELFYIEHFEEIVANNAIEKLGSI